MIAKKSIRLVANQPGDQLTLPCNVLVPLRREDAIPGIDAQYL